MVVSLNRKVMENNDYPYDGKLHRFSLNDVISRSLLLPFNSI